MRARWYVTPPAANVPSSRAVSYVVLVTFIGAVSNILCGKIGPCPRPT